MELFQLQTKSWFLPRQLFLQDPTLSTQEEPVYCHILSGAMTKQHSHNISLLTYQQNLEIYKWRYQQPKPILPIYNINLNKIIRTEAVVSVLCEKIFFGVQQIFDKLTISQKLFLFSQTIEGAKLLSNKLGYFKLTQKMMGLNQKGQIKLWLNQNHANNCPQFVISNNQQQFNQIIELFNKFCNKNQHFRVFLSSLKKQRINYYYFQEHLQKFAQNYQIIIAKEISLQKIVSLHSINYPCSLYESNISPNVSIKFSNQSTHNTGSQKQNSFKTKDSCLKSLYSPQNSNIPRYSMNTNQKRVRKSKSSNKLVTIRSKEQLSCLQDKSNNTYGTYIPKSTIGQIFLPHQTLYKSILVESDIKGPTIDINQLYKLRKLGRFCESTTAQQLILEEFKGIYG